MFCYQCEETSKGTGCTVRGVCGKDPTVAALLDLLVHATKGIAMYVHRARQVGATRRDLDVFLVEALFTTVTNVDFDPVRLQALLHQAYQLKGQARELYETAALRQGVSIEQLGGPALWQPAETLEGLVAQGQQVDILSRQVQFGPDLSGLQQLVTYGLTGTSAYLEHALVLGFEKPEIFAVVSEALDFLTHERPTADALTAWAFKVGALNLQVMELLDSAHTGTYGSPVPTAVRITPVVGKAILVSGHDLRDLDKILQATAGTGINVYTHGEMLPAHGYPKLKAYPHLVGNYGGAWQDQVQEFAEFPGSILMTTNCIQKPKESYRGRIFSSGLVGFPGVVHLANRNYGPLIEAAQAAPGFTTQESEKTLLTGFGHEAVLGVADKVIGAVKSGQLRHFFLVGGCDGSKSGRNYFTDFATSVPKDCVVMTLACGKYRFNKLDFGDIGGIPRLLDMGQCNDAYSAIKVAVALAGAFGCGVNDLPLSLVLSWYEQKAVAILLTLLQLGIKNIRLGPSLPAFLTPAVLQVLVEKFGIQPIKTAREDLATILGGPAESFDPVVACH